MSVSASPPNPHDSYFRQVMSRPADAASELQAVLPKAVAARIDWAGLELQSASFVKNNLRGRQADVLYRTSLAGHDAYIYILIEHQSSTDKLMPLRLLGYMVDIWEHHRDTNPNAETLPTVIPLVVHSSHKGRRWNTHTEFAELFDLDPEMRTALSPYVPHFQFLLDDVAALDLPTLLARDLTPVIRVMLVLHTKAPGSRHRNMLFPLMTDLRAINSSPRGYDDLVTIMHYIIRVSDITVADLQPIADQLGPRAQEALLTTADRLLAEGRIEGRAETLLDQLQDKFESVPADIADRVHAADPDQLRIWTRRILHADTLEDVFTQ
ncbi:Rpn family recombination-promoting nuclease/putative transposase [Nocardia arthritidis]|uniref:Transposase (putative) YhgA-like domain-containing protein n=1 Tax=Nocardia arthritidis TaxID=228602 RepID=A0A6G9YD30_9NOCA|nr:Rpn family recombination-promoting nuclease/putative transposase [Nocardia arthritidis]QIS10966.1 hypothetical protein F5544_15415 [Nocardia arthritidis]